MDNPLIRQLMVEEIEDEGASHQQFQFSLRIPGSRIEHENRSNPSRPDVAGNEWPRLSARAASGTVLKVASRCGDHRPQRICNTSTGSKPGSRGLHPQTRSVQETAPTAWCIEDGLTAIT